MNKNNVNVTAIINKNQYNRIKKIAEKNHQSMSGCVRVIIDDYMEKNKKNEFHIKER